MTPAPATPRARETADRCALRAQARVDPLAGTAFPAGRILAVEQPGAWGRHGLRDSDFGPLAAELEAAASARGTRLVAIRRAGRSDPGSARQWYLADCRPGAESLRGGTYTAPEELFAAASDPHAGAAVDGPLALVCTHGKHDPCCAIRGRPLAAALAGTRPDAVWECSHLGGDRFAANVLMLPLGLLYGRVTPDAAGLLWASADGRTVLVDHLRGRVGLPADAQVALGAAYAELGIGAVDALRVIDSTALEPGITRVRIAGADGTLAVRVRSERRAVSGLTCARPGPGFFVAHVADSIERF